MFGRKDCAETSVAKTNFRRIDGHEVFSLKLLPAKIERFNDRRGFFDEDEKRLYSEQGIGAMKPMEASPTATNADK
jgi:hypothetical protein